VVEAVTHQMWRLQAQGKRREARIQEVPTEVVGAVNTSGEPKPALPNPAFSVFLLSFKQHE